MIAGMVIYAILLVNQHSWLIVRSCSAMPILDFTPVSAVLIRNDQPFNAKAIQTSLQSVMVLDYADLRAMTK